MEASHDRRVEPAGVEPQPPAQGCSVRCRAVAFQFNAVLDDLDAPAGEAVHAAQGAGAEGAAGVDGVGKVVEHQAVGGPAKGRHHVGVVTAVLGEDQPRRPAGENAGQGGVEEGRVLMGMQHLDASRPHLLGHPPGHAEVAARPAVEADDLDTLLAQPFAQRPHLVQAKDHWVDAAGQPAHRLHDQHFGASYLHDVQDKANAERGVRRAERLPFRVPCAALRVQVIPHGTIRPGFRA